MSLAMDIFFFLSGHKKIQLMPNMITYRWESADGTSDSLMKHPLRIIIILHSQSARKQELPEIVF